MSGDGLPRTRASRARRARARDERGGVAVLVGIMMSLIVLAASFAVDLGMQRVLRSDLQALADVASLDAARLLDGRTAGEIRAGDATHPPLAEALADSVARNDTTLGETPRLEGLLVTLANDDLGAVVAVADVDGTPIEVADDEVPDAVMVRAESEVDFVFSGARGPATRTSLANATTFACFRVGSFAAALRSGDSAVGGVFTAMVGDALGVNLTAVGYTGMLNSSVALGDLAAELEAGTIEELAELTSLEVESLFAAYARVLGNDGRTGAQGEMAQLASQVDSDLTVNLAKILTTGNASAMAGSINAVDLLGSVALGVTAAVSDGNNFLKTGVPWSVAGVGGGEIALKAIEAPRQACGPVGSTASTAQVALDLVSEKFNVGPDVTVPLLGKFNLVDDLGTGTNAATITINASLAGATGTLVDATCGAGTAADPETISVDIDTRLLTVNAELPFRIQSRLGTTNDGALLKPGVLSTVFGSLISLTNPVTEITIDVDLRAVAKASLTVAPREATSPTVYAVPPRNYTDVQPSDPTGSPVSIPSSTVTLDLSRSTAKVNVTTRSVLSGSKAVTTTKSVAFSDLKIDLGSIATATAASPRIGSSFPAVLAEVNGALTPISKLLGIRTAGADLLVVAPPECGYPQLIG